MRFRSVRRNSIAATLGAALCIAGCAAVTPMSDPVDMTAVRSLPGWRDDDLSGIERALGGQCALARPPGQWAALCASMRAHAGGTRQWIEQTFKVRQLSGTDGRTDGMITGYHEPELRGSRIRTDAYQVPLHRRPDRSHPAARASRADIERQAALGGNELVWLTDRVEAFFLHIQGSGRIRLTDGSLMRVGYAGDNGHAYRAIGATLAQAGAMAAQAIDADAIKRWLRANPDRATEVMHANPRYIFFREIGQLPENSGPPGSLGVSLTPMRSIAVDPRKVPAGALLWLDTTDPLSAKPMRRLVVAQDTGAAIVGEVRADLFWGTGRDAQAGAGAMRQRGSLWLLEPR